MGGHVVTVREGPRVSRRRVGDREAALHDAEAIARDLAGRADVRPVDLRIGRSFEPVQQVFARVEIAGPRRLRAGFDVRGDGSVEGWTGRFRRRLVEVRRGESPYAAMRRTLE